MNEFRVVTVTNNLTDYPEYREDTEQFRYLVTYVEDDFETFVVDTREKGGFWTANEFFACVDIKCFIVDSSELPPIYS
jgi:hypothetical protein